MKRKLLRIKFLQRLPTGTAWIKIAAALSIGLAEVGASVISIGFEADEGYSAESVIKTYKGWNTTQGASASITKNDGLDGAQSLKIDAAEPPVMVSYQAEVFPQRGVRYIELGVRPGAALFEEIGSTLRLWGSNFGFVWEAGNTINIIVAGDGEEEFIPLGVPVDEGGRAGRWLHLLVRQDFDVGTWELYVDGELTASDLELSEEETESSLTIHGSRYAETYLDEIRITTAPSSVEESGEAISAETSQHSEAIATRRDEVSTLGANHEERDKPSSRRGGSAVKYGLTSPTLYVDNLNGNDSNSGFLSQAGEGDGPKASIKAAMAAAEDGATIVVLPGTGVYNEGSRGVKGKRITIQTVKRITIK